MKRAETTNTFQKGLMTDFNPLVTPDGVTTNCLNGTLITANGNENVLQNDLGNARVETARLPEGFIPLGTAELGGIIYIVSYNPLKETCQIGSFPSPERNITSDEIDDSEHPLNIDNFYADLGNLLLKTKSLKVELTDFELNPGDKFKIGVTKLDPGEISGFTKNKNVDINPKYLKLKVVALQDNGEVTDLSQTCVWHHYNNTYNYYLYPGEIKSTNTTFQDYDDLIKANFNTFQSKVSGKLGIIAELECIDNFDVAWDARKKDDNWDVYFFTNWTYSNDYNNNMINLYSILIQSDAIDTPDHTKKLILTKYPSSNRRDSTDIADNSGTIFYTPDEKTVDDIISGNTYDNNSTNPRRNDGTDNQFIIAAPVSILANSGKVDFTITPGMPFGYMRWQERRLSIDFDKLGSGECNLIEYRYYYNTDGSIKLNWGLETYPELGTEINEVKFNFYDFSENKNVQNFVTYSTSNGNLIDNYYKTGTNSWVSSGQTSTINDVPNLPDPTVPLTATKRTSYSGNLTDTIYGLDLDKLYLLEIEVPFVKTSNGSLAKTIKYYRLMYTCPIFNNYYYQEKYFDYKNIRLQDAIDNYHPIHLSVNNLSVQVGNVSNNIYLGDDKVTEIPPYLLQESAENKLYNIKIEETKNISYSLNVSNGLPIFDFTLTPTNITYTSEITDNSSKQVLVKSGNSDISLDTFDIISYDSTINGTSTNITLNQEIDVPMKVDYQTLTQPAVTKQLVPLTVATLWWSWHGQDTALFYRIQTNRDTGSIGESQVTGDNDFKGSYLMGDYVTMYNKVAQYLETNDVVVLCVSVNSQAMHDHLEGDHKYLMCRVGGATAGNNWDGYQVNDDNVLTGVVECQSANIQDRNSATQPAVFVYAIKSTNSSEINFYTFGAPKSYLQSSSNFSWFGLKVTKNGASGYLGWIYVDTVSNDATNPNYCDNVAKVVQYPFLKYYKVQDSNQPYEDPAYEWTRIYYYNDFIYTTNIIGTIENYTFSMKIDNVPITGNNLPLNLQYSYNNQENIILETSSRASLQPFLDLAQSGIMSTEIIDLQVPNIDGSLTHHKYFQGNADSSKVYDINFNPVEYLKVDFGQVLPYNADEVEAENLTNAENRIAMTRGSLAANIGWGAGGGLQNRRKAAQFIIRMEDQAAAVKYINMIPDPLDYIQS